MRVLKRIHHSLAALLVLCSPFAAADDFAPPTAKPIDTRAACEARLEAQKRAALAAFGEPGRLGGAAHGPPRNQFQSYICWSYVLDGLAESGKIARTGVHVHLSPEYLQLYNIYDQLKARLGYFRKLANQRRVNKDDLFMPSLAKFEKDAMELTQLSGLVPIDVMDQPIPTKDREHALEREVRKFIRESMLDNSNLNRYIGKDDDGINDDLFNDLAAALRYATGVRPPRPNETFTYRGATYTPRTFMSEYMQFDPDQFKAYRGKENQSDLILSAITDSIDRNVPVPIEIRLYEDVVNKSGTKHESEAMQTGVFSNLGCPGGDCQKVNGGHEVLVVNYLRDPKTLKITGLIAKNSWGPNVGLDVNGKIPSLEGTGGYYIFTAGYLKQALVDFVIEKDLANQPRYRRRFRSI